MNMLSLMSSTIFFILFLILGNLLQFLNSYAYYLVPLFLIFMWMSSNFYNEANTKALEKKDFILALVFVCISSGIFFLFHFPIPLVFYSYCYLSAFSCIVLYADSIRFKTLL